MKERYLALVSGGMDSTTMLYQYKEVIAEAVGFYYSQKHKKELNYASVSCDRLKIPFSVITLDFVEDHFVSNLLQGQGQIPDGHYEHESMKSTVVPFRNGIMLSIAIGIAASRGLKGVMIANHAGDHAIYPDCRPHFIDAMRLAAKFGNYDEIEIYAPYVNKTKRQIALIGKEIGVDYAWTWSCYKGGALHCGKCGTCVERKEALAPSDPTIYKEE